MIGWLVDWLIDWLIDWLTFNALYLPNNKFYLRNLSIVNSRLPEIVCWTYPLDPSIQNTWSSGTLLYPKLTQISLLDSRYVPLLMNRLLDLLYILGNWGSSDDKWGRYDFWNVWTGEWFFNKMCSRQRMRDEIKIKRGGGSFET